SILSLTGPGTAPWASATQVEGLSDVRASRFLRPTVGAGRIADLMMSRIENGFEHAARNGELYHLWWHPHNFGARTDENLAGLRRLLTTFRRCHEEWGFESLSMRDVARAMALGGVSAEACLAP